MITYDEEWKQAKVIVKVYRERKTFDTASKSWKDSNEMAFYISTILFSAKEFCQTIRDHWGIENRNHRVKDGSMKEDHSRIRVNPDRIAILRSFALNIMRANGAENISTEMYKNCLNF
jgi:predicted transposase YbfD/YdcC